MVSMDRIGLFYPKIVHTKREFIWDRFMAPNVRVGKEWIISIRFQQFFYTVKSYASCFLQNLHTLADTNIDQTFFFYKIHGFVLVNDVLGKPKQWDLHIFITRHWVIQKKALISAKNNCASGVEIVLFKMIFQSRRVVSGAL